MKQQSSDPITLKKSFVIRQDSVIDNINIPAAGSIISTAKLNISGMKAPTLYLKWDAATTCTALQVQLLVYEPKPGPTALLLDTITLNTAGGQAQVNPTALNGGYYWPLLDVALQVFLPNIKIQLNNLDGGNALNNVTAIIIGGE